MLAGQSSSRLLTLVFTDIVDSTALKAKHGDFRAGDLLERDRDHVNRLAEQHGGRVIDWAGDGCFLTFETSSEAVLFAVDLQKEHLSDPELPPIRIGIHMGEVTERTRADGTIRVEGLTVDLTARLESLAHPNQILMSEAVYKSARQRLRHREHELTMSWKMHGAFHLKGFEEPIEVCVVGAGEGSPLNAPVRSEKAWPASAAEGTRAEKPASAGDLRIFRRLLRRPTGVAAIVVLLLAIIGAMVYLPSLRSNQTEARVRWARDVVPEVQEHIRAGEFDQAYKLATEADEYIDDMLLDQLIAESSGDLSFETNEPGARVSYKPYSAPESDWRPVGATPIASLRLPVGIYRWRVELDGYEPREFVRPVYPVGKSILAGIDSAVYDLSLVPISPDTEGMAFVEASPFFPSITGIGLLQFDIDAFFIDVTEVTNAAYREFVEAGGYTDPAYWNEAFALAGVSVPFEDAMKRFVDNTGRPGPAAWVIGDIPSGKERFPVQGVSWFEAMAYARFRGKMLPTVYHWARAAFPVIEGGIQVLTPQMIAYSNLEGDGPIPVASTPDMSAAGAYNMAGNVREWCLNQLGDKRFAMGGKWDEPQYVLFNAIPIDPWDRSEGNGFRCMRMPEGARVQEEFLKPLGQYAFEANRNRYTKEALQATLGVFSAGSRSDFMAKVESSDTGHRHFDQENLTIAGPGTINSQLPIIIQKPKTGAGPWPAVIFQSGIDSLYLDDPDDGLVEWSQFIPQSDRILVRPILTGMYFRNDGNSTRLFAEPESRGALIRTWIQELNQTVAYLKTRPDVDPHAISYYGISLGAVLGVMFGASNDDVHALVLALGGLPALDEAGIKGVAPLVEEYAALVEQPTLMINGRFDFLFPMEESQKPLFSHLATDPAHKKLELFDVGHSMPTQADTIRVTLDWLDRYEHGILPAQAQ